MVAAGLPLSQRPSCTPEVLKKALGRGARLGTIRKRVRDLRPFLKSLATTLTLTWPTSAEHITEYMLLRASEPCGPSVLEAFQAALYFFERGGGVRPELMLSRDPLVLNILADLQAGLAVGRPKAVPAPREPVVLVASRERLVLDEDAPPYHRAYSWW